MENFFSAPENPSSRPPLDSRHANVITVDTHSAVPSSTQELTPPNPSDMLTPISSTSATNPSSSVPYTVFISHAGEDKETIAKPLREKLRAKGITAFVDEADMLVGTDAVQAMTVAMETAEVGVIILSPEFIAKKWPMKELMHFLKRREECSREGHRGGKAPTIIPCFYRLSVGDVYNEPNVYRKDEDGNLLYEKTRFFERLKSGEPEADVKKIHESLMSLRQITGVENRVNANNDSSSVMGARRGLLLDNLCSKICDEVPECMKSNNPIDTTQTRTHDSPPADSFRRWLPPKLTGARAVLDFESRNVEGRPNTPEGLVKQYLLEENSGTGCIVSLCGLGGVGKSTIVEALMSDNDTRKSFSDGVHSMRLGSDATSNTLLECICHILENSGAPEKKVQCLRERNNIGEVVDFFLTWFEGKRCVFFIDDVWEHSVNVRALSRLCDVASIDGGNRVLITTREHEIVSLMRNTRIVRLGSRQSQGEVALKILLFHAAVMENDVVMMDIAYSISEILDMCAGLPVSLAVAGKSVRKLSLVDVESPASVWARYVSRLLSSRETLLLQNVGSYGNLYSTFATSLKFLDEKAPEERQGIKPKFSFSEMHRRLCVLQKQAVVPNTMLMHLWGTESEESAEMIAMVFVEVGLAGREKVRNESESKTFFTLHDSVHDFAVWEARRHGKVADTHSLLLAGYGLQHEEVSLESENKKVRWWSRGLKDDGYIHKQLCRHLVESGQKKELYELLLTPLWVERQIEVNGIVCLEDDFESGMKEIGEGEEGEETKEALRLISKAVSLSLLHVLKNMRELWFQLHGRLQECRKGNVLIETYVKWMESEVSRPRVLSVNRVLLGAGGGTRKIIPVGSGVACMALFPDEERIACGCYDGSVIVVNIRRSEIERRWDACEDGFPIVSSIAVAQNGTRIMTLSYMTGRLDMWDVENGYHMRRIGGDFDRFDCFAITHDETCVASASKGSKDCSVQLWDLRSGGVAPPVMNRGHPVRAISLLKDGKRAMILYRNGKLKIWNIRTRAEMDEIGYVTDEMIKCVTVTPDERRVVSRSGWGKVRLWDLESRQQIWSSRSENYFVSVAVSKDGSRIASGDRNGVIQIWDVESRDEVCEPLRGHSDSVSGVSFLGSKDSIVSSSEDGTVRVWDIVRGTNENSLDGHGDDVIWGVSFTPDGELVVTGSGDHTLRIWNAASGQMVGDPLCGHSGVVNDAAVTPGGRFVVSVSEDKTVRVWDIESRNLRCTLTGHTDYVCCVAVTPEGDRAVTGSSDKTVRVWDLAKMDESHVVLGRHKSSVLRVFVSDDGLRVVSVDQKSNIIVWTMETQIAFLKTAMEHNAREMYRRGEVFSLIGEDTVHDDAGLSIRLGSNQIIHGKGSEARVLATLDSDVRRWDISPDKKTICLGLFNGQVAFLKVDA